MPFWSNAVPVNVSELPEVVEVAPVIDILVSTGAAGVTVIIIVLLVTLPLEAVIETVPELGNETDTVKVPVVAFHVPIALPFSLNVPLAAIGVPF